MSELSRTEDILKGNEVVPQSRVEVLLKELIEGGGGGSTVTVTPVLQQGVRLATIGVDGTDYNIYAPEDVVGSIVSVTTEYNTGTLLATITVNDVDHYIYVPEEEKEILTGFATPSATLGTDGQMYVQYMGDQETEAKTIWSGSESWSYYQPQWKKIGDFNPLDYYRIGIYGDSNGFTVNSSNLVSAILELSEQGSYWNPANRFGIKIENNSLYAIQTYRSGTSTLYSVTGTNITADGIKQVYSKTNGTWLGVPSLSAVDPELESGTLLATITVNDVPYYIYAPEAESGALYGFTDPNAILGSDKDMYIKYNGENVISDWKSGGSFTNPTQHAAYDIESSFGRDVSNDYSIKITIQGYSTKGEILISNITTSWTIFDGDSETGFMGVRINPTTGKIELHTNKSATHILQYKANDFTPISIDSIWHKTNETWHKEESGGTGSTNIYGYTAPADSIGSNGDIYGKIEDVSGEEECIDTPVSVTRDQVPKEVPLPRTIDQYNTIKISIHAKSNGADFYFNDILVDVSSLGTTSETATRLVRPSDGTYSYVNIYKSEGKLIASYSDWSICEITSLIGTYTSAHKVTDIYQKVEGHWSKFETDEIPEIEVNPSETPTETLESIKIDGIVYQLPSSANIGNFAFGTANTNSSFETEVQS